MPSIQSIKRAMQTYARQGGSSAIFINDDGLRILSPSERKERIAYYAEQGIGWVARPAHSNASDGFKRAGRFKKASNMNYGKFCIDPNRSRLELYSLALALSRKLERHLEKLVAEQNVEDRRNSSDRRRSLGFGRYGLYYQNFDESSNREGSSPAPSIFKPETHTFDELEEKALNMAIEEVYGESERRFLPWAANGKAMRIGELILLVDADTVVPSDCLRDAAREMAQSPEVSIIQHESGKRSNRASTIAFC